MRKIKWSLTLATKGRCNSAGRAVSKWYTSFLRLSLAALGMEVTRRCSFVWVYLLLLCSALAKAATPSVDLCPRYVEEGGNLTCRCTSGDCSSSDVTVSWLKTDGPTQEHMTIEGQAAFITNGTKTLTLTCKATDVYPPPLYNWLDALCQPNSNGNTCSFKPKPPDHDGKAVRCRASDTFRDETQSAVTDYTLSLKYPAYIASFTVNGTSGSLMVSEGDSQITLTCHVMSIYEPQITLAKRRGEDVEILSGDEMTVNVAGRIMTFTLINVTCDDMAVYTCFADDDKVDVHLRVLDCPVSTTSELLQVPFGAIAGAIFPCIVIAITIGCLYLWDKKKKGNLIYVATSYLPAMTYRASAGLYEKTTTSSAQDQDSSLYADLRPGGTSTSPQSASVTSDKEIRPELPTRDDPADRDDAACKRNTYQTLGEATDEIYTGLQAPDGDPDYLCPFSAERCDVFETVARTNRACYWVGSFNMSVIRVCWLVAAVVTLFLGSSDKAEVRNFTVNQRPHSDTVTEGGTRVTFICKASGYPTPTLRITFGSTQVSQSEQTSADKITSETVLTYTIPRVNCDDKGNYTCTADNRFTGAASVSVHLNINSCGKKPDEDLPKAAIVGGVLGGLLVLTTAALVGVLIWMKRNPRYEKPLPRRERKSDAYTGLHPPDNNTDQQSTAGIVNPQLQAELDESDRLHSYQNVLSSPDNTYDPLQMRERQNTVVYTELSSTGPGGRETDKAEVHNFTINQHQHSDTLTEGDRSVTFICEASGRPTPTLHISFGSEQVAVSQHTSDISITSQTALTYTILHVICANKGNYTCAADNDPRYEKPLPRRERESDTYTGLQPPDNNTARQTTPGIATPQHPTGLEEADRPHSYIDVLPPDNTYDPLQMTGRQSTAVYTDLRPTGPGRRGT
ncbi:hypothetical protein BaRGS_00011260, partial [Batillaria attramentaria]